MNTALTAAPLPPRLPRGATGYFFFAVGVMLAGLRVAVGCHAPDAAPVVETVTATERMARYAMAVDECRKVSVDAGDIDIFDRCVVAVNARFCQTESFRCGAPK